MTNVSLAELVQTKDIIFFDSSSVRHYRGEPRPSDPAGKKEQSAIETKFLAGLIEHIEKKGKIYLTSDIMSELFFDEAYIERLKRKIKVLFENGAVDSEQTAELEYLIQKNEEVTERLSLFKVLSEREQIIKSGGKNGEEPGIGKSFNHQERRSYHRLDEKFHWLQKAYGISDIDFDLIKTGLVFLTSRQEHVTIVSNDRGIKNSIGMVRSEKGKYSLLKHALREDPFAFVYSNGYHPSTTSQ